jgi:serine/threonine protein kinase
LKTTPLDRCEKENAILRELNDPFIITPQRVIRDLPHNTAGLLLERIDDAKTLSEVMSDLSWQPWNLEQCLSRPDAKMIFQKYDSVTNSNGSISQLYESCLKSFQQLGELHGNYTDEDERLVHESILALEIGLNTLRQFYQQLPLSIEDVALQLRSKGILHKDLRPENIVIYNNKTVKVLDFGMASKQFDDVWGSRAVMPPELYSHKSPDCTKTIAGKAHKNSDLWAVGVLAYEIAFGHHPFDPNGRDSSAIAQAVEKYAGKASIAAQRNGILLPFAQDDTLGLFDAYLQTYLHGNVTQVQKKEPCAMPNRRIDWERTGESLYSRTADDRRSQYARLFTYLAIRPDDREKFQRMNPAPHAAGWFADCTELLGAPASEFKLV